MLRIFSILILLVSCSAALAATPLTEQQKIDALLNAFDNPDITLIRNGEAHDGTWAKTHFTEKLKAQKPAITTADDFIAKVASTSQKTGKPYLIKTKDGKTVKSAVWLQAQLTALNAAPAAGGEAPAAPTTPAQ